jgi:hypothetical protein
MACVPVGNVWANVYSAFSVLINFDREGPSVTPLSFSFFDSVNAWPLWLRFISTAMSFFGPPMPFCTP